MPIELNATHDPQRRSFVDSANREGTDFPIQNLPFGVFDDGRGARGGVALGDAIIDLSGLLGSGALTGAAAEAAHLAARPDLASLFAAAPSDVSALRSALSELYSEGSEANAAAEAALLPAASARMLLPAKPGAFTDFCTSYDHIRRMGQRTPGLAALSLPVAYNGRASSVAASGTQVVRPLGQYESAPGSGEVRFGPEPMLDFELEFGAWLRGGNALGQPLGMDEAEAALFGCCLVNDWSARGIQFFESVLGPYLGKSFLTTASPWVVTMEALAPFRVSARGRDEGEPRVPGYLLAEEDRAGGAINIELTAELAAEGGEALTIVRSNLAELYWTLAQMVAHQASGGAPLEAGDLIATGTVSGAAEEARGCLAEITFRGGETIALPGGATRSWLEDGDTLTLRGRAIAEGHVPIGFGECSGTIAPARSAA